MGTPITPMEELTATVALLAEGVEEMRKNIQEIRNVQDRMETDMTFDRGRIDNVNLELISVKARQKELMDRVPRIENKVKDAVVDGLREIVDPIMAKMDTLVGVARKNKISIKPNEKSIMRKTWEKFFIRNKVKGGEKK